jgi:fucose permease
VIGFIDIVGISTFYLTEDFSLSPIQVSLFPFLLFACFFVFAIPVGIVQSYIGKKNSLVLGLLITALGMFIAFVGYQLSFILIAFCLLGIGSVFIQVSVNPLLQEKSTQKSFFRNMIFSQFIKTLSSLLGPLIVGFTIVFFGNWNVVFLCYGVFAFVLFLLVKFYKLGDEQKIQVSNLNSIKRCLTDKKVWLLATGLFVCVGIDVGLNTNIVNYFNNVLIVREEESIWVLKLYFFITLFTRFLSAILFSNFDKFLLLLISVSFIFLGLIGLIIGLSYIFSILCVILLSSGLANFFPLLFSILLNYKISHPNEISSIAVLSVVGGAIIPLLMGIVSQFWGLGSSFLLLIIGVLFLGFVIFELREVVELK